MLIYVNFTVLTAIALNEDQFKLDQLVFPSDPIEIDFTRDFYVLRSNLFKTTSFISLKKN